uniref:FAD-dependent oxidoreductase n=1 Tax=Burkholderia sp. Ac-20379 TaxID=2703900 RepID=UPI0019805ACC
MTRLFDGDRSDSRAARVTTLRGTRDATVAIVGGGLAGLVAAWRLERHGVDAVLIEAGERLGGRIESPTAAQLDSAAACAAESARVDLGATWFWPSMQPALSGLIDALGLPAFAQHEAGDMLVERSPHGAPQRLHGYATGSMRLDGGMTALVDAVRARLRTTRIVTGETVRRIGRVARGVELDAIDPAGRIATYRAGHVLLALPPRLAAATIAF